MISLKDALAGVARELKWRQRLQAAAQETQVRKDEAACKHPNAVLAEKIAINGQSMYGLQCLDCGRLKGAWISAKSAAMGESLPCKWDENIAREYWNNKMRGSQRGVTLRAQVYDAYLASPEWKRLRNKVIARAHGVCEGCGDNPITEVHHITYDRVGTELLYDLAGLCGECHALAHDGKMLPANRPESPDSSEPDSASAARVIPSRG